MRSNFFITAVILGLAVSLGVFFMASGPRPVAPPARVVVSPVVAPAPAPNPALAPAAPGPPNLESPGVDLAPGGSPEERHAAYVEARQAELMSLAMNDDAESLNTILSELANRDPKIRETAVQAAVQFHSRDALPRLQDAALQTDDARERAAIEAAIEFLKLPTLTEVLQEQARQAQAGGTNSPAPK